MLLELTEDLLAQRIGDLRIDARVLDVLVAQMIGHVRDSAAGFQEMHGHGVAQGVDRTLFDAGRIGVIVKELLRLALLQGPLAAGEEIGPDVSALTQIAA